MGVIHGVINWKMIGVSSMIRIYSFAETVYVFLQVEDVAPQVFFFRVSTFFAYSCQWYFVIRNLIFGRLPTGITADGQIHPKYAKYKLALKMRKGKVYTQKHMRLVDAHFHN